MNGSRAPRVLPWHGQQADDETVSMMVFKESWKERPIGPAQRQ
eukprot:CAMPEP_0206589370 /NCGR_PEP_ID=MMETSP0325_2-20121206/38874_1 /ASSEMBLY_ACC=CAM_ASM_000347 /TAXON_ID=2866 /ORGANISM="Crypthecodinium cohnii, Strain Seligo" /LENGTH=42 /DNA_ID= /DNA_START= /DNA_END= /DNA_ORIENTATION=